jgi:hypothetical protein
VNVNRAAAPRVKVIGEIDVCLCFEDAHSLV